MEIFKFLYVFRFFKYFIKVFLSKLVRKAIFTGSCIVIWGAVGGGVLDLIRKISQIVVLDCIPMSVRTLLNVVFSWFGVSFSVSGSRPLTMTHLEALEIWLYKSSLLRDCVSSAWLIRGSLLRDLVSFS